MKKLNPNYIAQKELNQDKWGSWQYNVRDELKPLSVEEIKEHLTHNKLPCAVLMQNIEGDFNFGNIVRTSNNFNIAEIFYYGKKKWDRRSAAGTYHYSPIVYLSSLEEVVALKNTYQFVALENNVDGCVPIKDFVYPVRPIFLFGEENSGLTPELLSMADFTVEIPSRGSVRSLNVGSAAAILLYDFYAKSCPQTSKQHDEPEWTSFLNRLPSLGLSRDHADDVRTVWAQLSLAIPDLGLPAAGPTADNEFQLVWDRGRHHLDLDIRSDGSLDWFYVNRESGTKESGEASVTDPIPDDLHSYLAAFFRAP